MTEPSRWGFAGLTDAEYDDFVHGPPAQPAVAEQRPHPREPGAVRDRQPVRVEVGDDGVVAAIELASDWRSHLEPRALGAETLRRFHREMTHRLLAAASAPADPPPSPSPIDLTRWGGDVGRLADEAREDARRLRQAVHQHLATSTTVHSTNGHAWGVVRGAEVVEVSTDPHWAATAHRVDIEAELLEVLRRLQSAAAPARLTQGPVSPAAQTIAALVRDPLALTRAAGLNP